MNAAAVLRLFFSSLPAKNNTHFLSETTRIFCLHARRQANALHAPKRACPRENTVQEQAAHLKTVACFIARVRRSCRLSIAVAIETSNHTAQTGKCGCQLSFVIEKTNSAAPRRS